MWGDVCLTVGTCGSSRGEVPAEKGYGIGFGIGFGCTLCCRIPPFLAGFSSRIQRFPESMG